MLLPPSLDELIAKGLPIRVVNQVLDKIDIDPLLKKYKEGGSSSFHRYSAKSPGLFIYQQYFQQPQDRMGFKREHPLNVT